MRIFVGNLSFNTSDNDLRDAFAAYGEVVSANIIMDRETQRSRGFGFVDMADDDARKAISGLNESQLQGRALTVNEAKPRAERAPRGNSWS